MNVKKAQTTVMTTPHVSTSQGRTDVDVMMVTRVMAVLAQVNGLRAKLAFIRRCGLRSSHRYAHAVGIFLQIFEDSSEYREQHMKTILITIKYYVKRILVEATNWYNDMSLKSIKIYQ